MWRTISIFLFSVASNLALILAGVWSIRERDTVSGTLFIISGAARLGAFYVSVVHGLHRRIDNHVAHV